MGQKNIQAVACLTMGLLALLLGACATTQNRGNGVTDPVPNAVPSAQETPIASSDHKSRTYTDVWERIRDGFRLPAIDSPYIDYYVHWYAERPEYVARLNKRASKYLYYIVQKLDWYDFPMEIALLPAIESAYRPVAHSHADAVGLWQFISATGRRYGLKQNWWYDGRRDVIDSTDAAIQYLSFLHELFDGNWFHALAAYNAGERRVQEAIDENRREGKPTAFENLDLWRETERYVPKLLAFKRIVQDPERYGLTLTSIPNRPYFQVVETGSQVDLGIVADAAGLTQDQLHTLNAGFRRWATDPSGPYRVLVPVASAKSVKTTLADLPRDERMDWAYYRVRRGDTLGQIARRFNVKVRALRSSNGLSGSLIHPGQTLLLPLSPQAVAAARGAGIAAAVVDLAGWVPYRVRRGDTLSEIARRYDTTIGALRRSNRLHSALLRVGQSLRVPATGGGVGHSPATLVVRRGDTLSQIADRYDISVNALKTSNDLAGNLIRVGQTLRMPEGGDSDSGAQAVAHRVKMGDTLWDIAQEYKVNVKQLLHWNELTAQDILRLGQVIMIYRN